MVMASKNNDLSECESKAVVKVSFTLAAPSLSLYLCCLLDPSDHNVLQIIDRVAEFLTYSFN